MHRDSLRHQRITRYPDRLLRALDTAISSKQDFLEMTSRLNPRRIIVSLDSFDEFALIPCLPP